MWHDTKWISLNLHRQSLQLKTYNIQNYQTMAYVSSMFSSMSLFALQRCNLTHREMTIAGRLMGANNELTIQCHFYTFARCGDAAGLMLTVNHRLQSCDWCPQFLHRCTLIFIIF